MAEQRSNSSSQGGGQATESLGVTGSGVGASSPQQARGELRQQVESAADTQNNRAGDGLGSIADVARRTGEDLRAQNETLGRWVQAASDQLRHMADGLRNRPAAALADDLTQFARQRPAAFLGGAFLLGLGMARVLKSSPQRGVLAKAMATAVTGGSAQGHGGCQPPSYAEPHRASGEVRPGGTTPSSGAH